MPGTIYERPMSRPFEVSASGQMITLQYFVSGESDEDAAFALVTATAPVSSGVMARTRIKCDRVGPAEWFADVEYSPIDSERAVGTAPTTPTAPASTDPLNSAFTIDTSSQTVHITQSIATISATKSTGAFVPDNAKAIGVTTERVEGTDIYVPALQWTRTVRRSTVTLAYLVTLYALSGRVNNAAFYGFPAGEVLYLGCTGSLTSQGYWELTHKFACAPNQVSVDVGGGITVAAKKGWEYLWVGYKPDVVGGNKVLMVPATAYVEQVYQTANLGLIGIGA